MGLITNSLQFSGDTYESTIIVNILSGSTTLDSDPNSLATNQVIKNYIDGNTGETSSLSTAISSEISTRGSYDSSLSTSILQGDSTTLSSAKVYTDAVAQGVSPHAPVRVVSTLQITLSGTSNRQYYLSEWRFCTCY
jgi:hypothetical protein